MRIGIDFDNTIVSYDALFHKIALEKGLIPKSFSVNKIEVRNYLRVTGHEDSWTLMQGEAYGPRMAEAIPYSGSLQFMKNMLLQGNQLNIVSHKTKYPFAGPKYDLHAAATKWIYNCIITQGIYFNKETQIFFESTKEDKITRIRQLNCDIFIDDLPEILSMSGFRKKTRRILFDPEQQHQIPYPDLEKANSWKAVEELITNG
jgi:hypothetical protein